MMMMTSMPMMMMTLMVHMMMTIPMMMPMLMMVPMLMAGVYIMPLAHTWPDPAEVLVQTSGRNYTVRDYPAFFRDIGFPEVTMIC